MNDNIENMAKAMSNNCNYNATCSNCDRINKCRFIECAINLDAANYRKQSDTVKDFMEKVRQKVEIYCDFDNQITTFQLYTIAEKVAASFGVDVKS